jgi:hypothetical protein
VTWRISVVNIIVGFVVRFVDHYFLLDVKNAIVDRPWTRAHELVTGYSGKRRQHFGSDARPGLRRFCCGARFCAVAFVDGFDAVMPTMLLSLDAMLAPSHGFGINTTL